MDIFDLEIRKIEGKEIILPSFWSNEDAETLFLKYFCKNTRGNTEPQKIDSRIVNSFYYPHVFISHVGAFVNGYESSIVQIAGRLALYWSLKNGKDLSSFDFLFESILFKTTSPNCSSESLI